MKLCIFCGNPICSDHWYCDYCKKSPPKNKSDFILFDHDSMGEGDCFNEKLFDELSKIEKEYFWFFARRALIKSMIKKYFKSIGNLLEIGIGTGTLLQTIEVLFPKIRTFGADIHLRSLEYASKRLKRTKLFQMNVTDIPFNNEFDLICAFDLIEHVEDDQLALNNMYKAIRNNGGILITVPQHHFLWSQFDYISCHKRRYTKHELINKIKKAGFEIIRATSFMTALFPLLCLTRFLNNKKVNNKFIDYFKINKSINIILKRIMGAERILLERGIKLPFGGSLLIVAKK